jgi:hypothetical protein
MTPCSRLRWIAVLIVVVAAVFASSVPAQAIPLPLTPRKLPRPEVTPTQTPPEPTPTDTQTAKQNAPPAPPPTPAPTPSVDTYAVPAPSAIPGSKDFAYTPNVQCTDVVANATFLIYSHNRALFDKCVVEGKYQIFPYPGEPPTNEQLDAMVRATSCRSVFTVCVLANLPQCDMGGMGLKSATETLLKISVDVMSGKPAPDSKKFYEMLVWRRDVNLAQAKGIPYDQKSQLYGEFSRNLWKALTNTTVTVSSELRISLEGNERIPSAVFANITTGSDASDIVGKVTAPDISSRSANFINAATPTPSLTPTPTSASRSRAACSSRFVAGTLAAVSVVLTTQWWHVPPGYV